MSKDVDLEEDSPDSSIHLDNVDIEELNNDVFLKRQTRAMTQKSLEHKSESRLYTLCLSFSNHLIMNL